MNRLDACLDGPFFCPFAKEIICRNSRDLSCGRLKYISCEWLVSHVVSNDSSYNFIRRSSRSTSAAIISMGCFVMILAPAVPFYLRHMFIPLAVAAQNTLACWIFRQTLHGLAEVRSQRSSTGQELTIQFCHEIDAELSSAFSKRELGEDIPQELLEET